MSAQHSTVSEVMTRDVVTVSPDTPFKEITSARTTHGIGAVPVADTRGSPMDWSPKPTCSASRPSNPTNTPSRKHPPGGRTRGPRRARRTPPG